MPDRVEAKTGSVVRRVTMQRVRQAQTQPSVTDDLQKGQYVAATNEWKIFGCLVVKATVNPYNRWGIRVNLVCFGLPKDQTHSKFSRLICLRFCLLR